MKIEPRTFTLPNGEVLTVRSLCADDAEALSGSIHDLPPFHTA